jgi:hypothetical protein
LVEKARPQSSHHQKQDILNSYKTKALLRVEASLSEQLVIATAMMWLCSAIRHSPTGLQSSRASISSGIVKDTVNYAFDVDDPILNIFIDLIDLAMNETETSCWHYLFDRQVIARDFPIPMRKKGTGLEISFPNMAALAHSMNFVRIDEGLIAEGLVTVLIPSESLQEAEELACSGTLR